VEELPLDLSDDEIRKLSGNDRFQFRIRQLLDFKARHGNYQVRIRHNRSLAKWVLTQKYEYRLYKEGKQTLLTPKRVQQLNSIGFEWKKRDAWMEKYLLLKEFHQQHGHVRLRKNEAGALGKWVVNQRDLYRRYQRGDSSSKMTPERIQLLEQVGMIWSLKEMQATKHDEKWNRHYQELVEYQKQHGHVHVPKSQGSLGVWVVSQRRAYDKKPRGEPSSLTDRRQALLEGLRGFRLDNGRHAWQNVKWEQNYQRLKHYYQEHGHSNVPTGTKPLGRWVSKLRHDYKLVQQGKLVPTLTREQIERLEREVDFQWQIYNRRKESQK
jgi:hypothetical protein